MGGERMGLEGPCVSVLHAASGEAALPVQINVWLQTEDQAERNPLPYTIHPPLVHTYLAPHPTSITCGSELLDRRALFV